MEAWGLSKDMQGIKVLMIAMLALLLQSHAFGQTKITAYGYPGDLTPDSASSAGIGNHDNVLSPYQGGTGVSDAALTALAAQQYGVGLGQTFTATAANGVTYTLRYEDTAPQSDSRIDIFDPNQLLTAGNDNNFSTGAVAVNSNPVSTGDPTLSGLNGNLANANQTGNGAQAVQDISIPIINPMLQKFQSAAQTWARPLINGVTTLFWILVLISGAWTAIWMALRRAELIEIAAELVRFILFTGFFYWLLVNGPYFAQAIISSLRQLGGQASGAGQTLYPVEIVNLGVAVLQAQMNLVNWLFPVGAMVPLLLALIILITTILVAANVVVILVSAWIVIFAGVVVLGFGGCRWTSEIAVNYFRTALGVGLSLLVLELILGIAMGFLQGLVQQGQSGDLGQLIALTIAVILIAILAHRLPSMVSGMMTGSGHHGGMGSIGFLAAVGAALAAAAMARNAATGALGAFGRNGSRNPLQERIAAAEAAMRAGSRHNGNNGGGSE